MPGDRKSKRLARRTAAGSPSGKPNQRGLSVKRHMPVERRAWEITDGESSGAYEYFKAYRDMNPIDRSIAAIAKLFGKSMSAVTSLSSDYSWNSRAAAWDFHIERARLEFSEQYQLDMFKRHQDVCVSLIDKVKARLAKMNPNELAPRDVIQWIDIATKIERLSRGVANDNVAANLTQINVQVDNMSRLSTEELERIIADEKKRKLRADSIEMSALPAPDGKPAA